MGFHCIPDSKTQVSISIRKIFFPIPENSWIPLYGVITAFSHDVPSAMLVMQSNETTPMLVFHMSPVRGS